MREIAKREGATPAALELLRGECEGTHRPHVRRCMHICKTRYGVLANFLFSASIQASIRSRMPLSEHSSRSFSSRVISALICAISSGDSMAGSVRYRTKVSNIDHFHSGIKSSVEVMSQNLHSALDNLFDSLTSEPPRERCSKCGSKMMHLDATFFSSGPSGKVWTVPLPVCPHCDLKEDTVNFVAPSAC